MASLMLDGKKVAILVLCSVAVTALAQSGAGDGGKADQDRGAGESLKRDSSERETAPGPASERDAARCKQLTGEPREQCLRELGASAGRSAAPQNGPASPMARDPVAEPPPQNPGPPR